MSLTPPRAVEGHQLADHNVDLRMIILAAMALVVGTGGALGAWVLVKLIAIATNLFWFGRFSAEHSVITDAHVGLLVVAIPIIGSLIVGLMARFGSDKIRGHGIPEAIETILFGESRLSLKVALLKPLSSAISIGSGGPFGAEGPIIMTGGAIGSLFAQRFSLSAAERKTLLVAGAAAGMTAIFGTPLAPSVMPTGGSRSKGNRSPRSCWRSRCCCSNGNRAASSRSWWRRWSLMPGGRCCSARARCSR